MKTFIYTCTLICMLTFASCRKDVIVENEDVQAISAAELKGIEALGFSSYGVVKIDSGYYVEGDIFVHKRDLNKKIEGPGVRVAETEHYRTTITLDRGAVRTIRIYASPSLPTSIIAAVDNAIARYNALGLILTFQRISFSWLAHITVRPWSNPIAGYWGVSGTPSNLSTPYPTIDLNVGQLIPSFPPTDINFLATIVAHEMGHCIGFRHTDYMNRLFSGCFIPIPQSPDEGAGTEGAVHVPNTPTGPSADSWMLACIGHNVNRPFTASDQVALDEIY